MLLSPHNVYASSLTDVMEGMGDQQVPEDDLLSGVTSGVTAFAGILISVIIYLFFALTALTTAIDLLYIAFPSLRNFLCPNEQSPQGRMQSQFNQPRGQMQAQFNQHQGQLQAQQKAKKCWITNELKKIMQTTSLNDRKTIISRYFKARIVNIVFAVMVMILLVSTSVFTDAGVNIGKALLDFLGF